MVIDQMTGNPFLGRALTEKLRGLRLLPVGGYRVLYEAPEDHLMVTVLHAAQRRESYRWRSR